MIIRSYLSKMLKIIIPEEERSDILRINNFRTGVGRVEDYSSRQGEVQREIIEGDLRKRGEGSRRQGWFFDLGATSGRPPITD